MALEGGSDGVDSQRDRDLRASQSVWDAVRDVGALHTRLVPGFVAAVQVFDDGAGARVTWIADFLPHEAAAMVGPMMEQGMAAMKTALDALANAEGV